MKLKHMMYIALFTAVVGVLGFFPPITLPVIPVPITLQTLGVMLAGGILGARRGGLSLLLFLLLLCIGLPLLAGGRGGIGPLVAPGGGYILSWPVAAFVIGYLVEKNFRRLGYINVFVFNWIGGVLLINLCGITFMSVTGDLPWVATAISSMIFLPGDTAKAVIASYVTVKFNRLYPIIRQKDQPANERKGAS